MSTTADRPLTHQSEDLVDDLSGRVSELTRELIAGRLSGSLHPRGWLVRRTLAGADVIGLSVAFIIGELISARSTGITKISMGQEFAGFFLTLPLWVLAAHLYGLYRHDEERTDHTTIDDFSGVFHLVTVGTWLVFIASSISGVGTPNLDKIVSFWLLAILLMTAGRVAGRTVCRRSASYVQNTLIVGAGSTASLIARKIRRHPEYGLNLVGFVDEGSTDRAEDLDGVARFSSIGALPSLVRLLEVDRVIVAHPADERERVVSLVRKLREIFVQIDIVPYLFESLSPDFDVHSLEGLPLLGLRPARLPRSSMLFKRMMDLTLSTLGLLLLAPLFGLIAVAIKLGSRGPVFFGQVRMGRKGNTFRIFKFRTMCVDAEERKKSVAHLNRHAAPGGDDRMCKIPDDPRVTRVGRFLRHYSLDELPQLLNVFTGEMSLVGPRPLILEEDHYVGDWARHRLDLKPGVTGPWQVLGRDEIPFGEMVELDYSYVTNWSMGGDFKLILRTVPVVLNSSAV